MGFACNSGLLHSKDPIPRVLMVAAAHTPTQQGWHCCALHCTTRSHGAIRIAGGRISTCDGEGQAVQWAVRMQLGAGNGQTAHIGLPHNPSLTMSAQWWRAHARWYRLDNERRQCLVPTVWNSWICDLLGDNTRKWETFVHTHVCIIATSPQIMPSRGVLPIHTNNITQPLCTLPLATFEQLLV